MSKLFEIGSRRWVRVTASRLKRKARLYRLTLTKDEALDKVVQGLGYRDYKDYDVKKRRESFRLYWQ
jgi:hypothetical protein